VRDGRGTGALAAAVAGALCVAAVATAAATGENYRFRRTAGDEAAAAAAVLERTDLPGTLVLRGGRSKPDEKAETAADTCNGRLQEEHDLVVTGDAQSDFKDPTGILHISTEIRLFETARMAATDMRRDASFATRACFVQQSARQKPALRLVGFRRLGSVVGVSSSSYQVEFAIVGRPRSPHIVIVYSDLVKGRVRAQVGTTLLEIQSTAPTVALQLQAYAVSAVTARLR
jgi:hypothetical protein